MNLAYQLGVSRIELCSEMALDGLTPSVSAIKVARQAFRTRPGLMVMVRPRAGGFCYSTSEVNMMFEQISTAAEHGANGVVFGVLNADSQLDINNLEKLCRHAKRLNLQITFHRAFDAIKEPLPAISSLIELGVERVLTSGVKWKAKGNALDGINRIKKVLHATQGKLEVVVGGGVTPHNADAIVDKINDNLLQECSYSLHSYSGVLSGKTIDKKAVQQLVRLTTY